MKLIKIFAIIAGIFAGKSLTHLLFHKRKYAVIGGAYDR